MLDKSLLNDLFGTEKEPETEIKLEPVKENESNIFSYRQGTLQAQEIILKILCHGYDDYKQRLINYLSKLKRVRAYYTVNVGYFLPDCRVNIFCKDSKFERELIDELHKCPTTEALLILNYATNNDDLAESIIERACIRWANGYSDSLFLTVLCNLREIGEIPSKKLKPVIDWRVELGRLGITLKKGVGLDLFVSKMCKR